MSARRAIWVERWGLVPLVVCALAVMVGCTASPDTGPDRPAQNGPEIDWPDAGSAGVPQDIALQPYGGPLEITTPGTVIDGYDITGVVVVAAPDVTIKNSRITGRIDTGDDNAYPGTVIENVEIVGPYDSAQDGGFPAVGYTGFTCDRCLVRGWGKGFGLVKDVTIRNSWVYDIQVHGDPANGGSHNEAILSLGGSNFTIVGNRLDAGDAPNVSAALALYSQLAPIEDVLVQGNLFDGGGYCLYAGLAGDHGATNTRFIGNTFGDKYAEDCGGFGPAIAYSPDHGNKWQDNVLASTGSMVPPPDAD